MFLLQAVDQIQIGECAVISVYIGVCSWRHYNGADLAYAGRVRGNKFFPHDSLPGYQIEAGNFSG